MDTNVGDILQCEEQLRTTLHCDDKEKLRKTLAELQREYLKTAQRLQRAERLAAVRKHVRSRISRQDQSELDASCATASPLSVPNTSTVPAKDLPQTQGPTEGAADSDASRQSQVIRFTLSADAACPQTPKPGHDGSGHRPSPALRLRSRRSRLRWERRSAEGCIRQKDGEQSERLESGTTEEERQQGPVESTREGVEDQSGELFSSNESESPSMLLTHWNSQGHTNKAGADNERELQGQQRQGENQTHLQGEGKDSKMAFTTEEDGQIVTHDRNEGMEKIGGDSAGIKDLEETDECKENSIKDAELKATESAEGDKNHDEAAGKKGENSQMTEGERAESLLDSCTLVEGLLFPVEYYVRTTRRMTLSRSQPDLRAVILSQLNVGRQRKSRARGKGVNRGALSGQRSDQHPQADFSSPTTAPSSPDPRQISNPVTACQMDSPARSPPVLTPAPSARGKRRSRGKGRGRSQSSGDSQPPSTPPPSSTCCYSEEVANPGPMPQANPPRAVVEPEETQTATVHSTDSQPSSGINGDPSSSASQRPEKVYPLFLKSRVEATKPVQLDRGSSSCSALLLPSSSSPAQTSLLPLPSMFSGNNLMNLDLQQDFHLPDDQFASLKLCKLRWALVKSGVEGFSTPSRNTRSSTRRSTPNHSGGDHPTSVHVPLSLTPTLRNSPHSSGEHRPVDLQNFCTEHEQADVHAERPLSSESVCVAEEITADLDDKQEGPETATPPAPNRSTSVCTDNPQPQPGDAVVCRGEECVLGQSEELKAEQTATRNQRDCCDAVHSFRDEGHGSLQVENGAIPSSLSSDEEKAEAPAGSRPASQASCEAGPPAEAPANATNGKPSSQISKVQIENETRCPWRPSELLLSSPLASAPCPMVTPHLPSSMLTSSPTLPSLGLTPQLVILPDSSPSAPSLTLPPPHSPSTQALSPPALSPCPSITHLPPSLPPLSLFTEAQAPCEPPTISDRCQEVEPASCPTAFSFQPQSSAGPVSQTPGHAAEKQTVKRTHTLKAAAGGALVDACCVVGSSLGLCVAAAGKWAVCLWTQTPGSDWSLTHTWTFSEPVISVFPVPDAAGLMCVTLGQLEIREVRVLSCSSLTQKLVCEGVIQAVAGVSASRVVTSSHSASGSTLQVLTLSDSSSSPACQPLASPGVGVGALAPVEGLSDALIGTDEGGHLFVWNLKTGLLLCRVRLGESLSHTACLRGYSYCGVLLVLLQHHFLSSMEEENEKEVKIRDLSEEGTKTAFFSLVGINPLSGKSVLASRLYPPEAWSGRLCEADVNHSSVVGLSQSGCVCVWELGQRGGSRLLEAPEGEDWQLARWGGGDVLVIGHHNGDISLHSYSASRSSL
ncbi:unnamed protein product [Menidia menidia]|uniref:(Atlantic silverside) hypothetical protein n=1 Tax=Menidia menidia TaxID=238744 RepID=A0A8S4B3J4_9TELE|nr:unnamed protein product [Menidia menidia]